MAKKQGQNHPPRRDQDLIDEIANGRFRDFKSGRGTPVTKYAENSLAGGAGEEGSLSKRCQLLLQDLEEAAEQMRRWGNLPIEKLEAEHKLFAADRAEYDRLIGRAIRAGLSKKHPYVREWLAGRRSLGEWDKLRKYRAGLERGVKRPMSKRDFWVVFHATPHIEKGKGYEEVRRALINELELVPPETWDEPPDAEGDPDKVWFGLTPGDIKGLGVRLRTSRTNFRKWLRRLGLFRHPVEPNKL